MKRKQILIAALGAVLLLGIVVTLVLLKQSQDTRSKAAEPTPPIGTLPTPTKTVSKIAQACATPAVVNSVSVNFPNCEGTTNCNFTQASCTWDLATDGSSYKVKITEVETLSVVKEETLAPTIGKTVFSINQGKTYKCDVSAVNSCGTASIAASDELLCQVDAKISPTVPPTSTPTPTPPSATVPPTIPPTVAPPTPTTTVTPIPTKLAPTVTLAKPGGTVPTLGIIGGVAIAIIAGIVLLIL